jgi:hypothetical protein
MEKTYCITKEQFIATTAAWNTKQSHSAAEHIIYNILRSKPTDLGFTKKTHSIQGNDPWFGYNSALWQAGRFLKNGNFKNTFGIDMPENLADKLGGSK